VAGHRYKIIASRRLLIIAAFCNKICHKRTHAVQQLGSLLHQVVRDAEVRRFSALENTLSLSQLRQLCGELAMDFTARISGKDVPE
jgi:hypothetical protein